MSETHTPGPWSVGGEPYDDWGMVRGLDGGPVADAGMCFRYTDEEATQACRDHSTPPVVLANARLIAAAPELLEYARLEEAVEEFECPHDAEARCDCGPRHDAMYQRARKLRKAAIAKASGEQP